MSSGATGRAGEVREVRDETCYYCGSEGYSLCYLPHNQARLQVTCPVCRVWGPPPRVRQIPVSPTDPGRAAGEGRG
jgi:hypothetical protein